MNHEEKRVSELERYLLAEFKEAAKLSASERHALSEALKEITDRVTYIETTRKVDEGRWSLIKYLSVAAGSLLGLLIASIDDILAVIKDIIHVVKGAGGS